MFTKNTKIVCVFIFLISVLISFTACGVSGNLDQIDPPNIRITSYSGDENPDDAPLRPFQQTIFWAADSQRGVVTGYAYRVLNSEGKPISTPENVDIDEDGTVTKEFSQELFQKYGPGWVLHYEKHADRTIPLSNPASERTVFTDNVFTTVNFPAYVGDHELPYEIDPVTGEIIALGVPGIFEVVAIDNRGNISTPARRYFMSKSAEPELIIGSSAGYLHDSEIGQGVRILFLEQTVVLDDVVVIKPWYFEYQLFHMRIPTEIDGKVPFHPDSIGKWLDDEELWDQYMVDEYIINNTQWYDTKGQDVIGEIVLTSVDKQGGQGWNPTPRLYKNVENDVRTNISVLKATMIDMSGVRSKPRYSLFYVNDKYKPSPLFYSSHTYVLGEHHFFFSQLNNNTDIPPMTQSGSTTRMADQFTATPVLNEDGSIADYEWAVVSDANTRFWFRWGYFGEFENNNPNLDYQGVVRDPQYGVTGLGHNYMSEIIYYHIQRNGKQHEFGPLLPPFAEQPDPDWLRIPANHEIAQRLSINGLTAYNGIDGTNLHSITVVIEDLQNIKSEPVTFYFRVYPPATAEERSGVLYVDNHNNTPAGLFDWYRDIMPADQKVTYISRRSLQNYLSMDENSQYNIRMGRLVIPFSLLTRYKYVIYAVDSSSGNWLNVYYDQDSLRQYARNNGNLILIGNQALENLIQEQSRAPMRTFYEDYFGWGRDVDSIVALELGVGPNNVRYYMTGATPVITGLPILNAEYENNPETQYGIRTSERGGLGLLSYFTKLAPTAEVMYTLNSKPAGTGRWDPSVEDREAIQGRPVAIRKDNNGGFGYTFTVPLYHMNKENVKALLSEILK